MQFTHDGQTYRLEFERSHKKIVQVRDGRVKELDKSKYPYTTVKLFELKVGVPKRLIQSATVGCFVHDRYSNEEGRKAALRALVAYFKKNMVNPADSETLLKYKAFATAIWDAYEYRNVPLVAVSNEQKLLPEQTETAKAS